MNNKPFYKSLTIQGLVVILIVAILQLFNVDFDKGSVTEFAGKLLEFIAVVVAFVGRIKANTKLSVK